MLSLLKKNSGHEVHAPAWHPNFRDFAQLPDTKVVRTSFFVNGVAIFGTIALLLASAYQEYNLYNLRVQIEQWQQQIHSQKRASDQNIALYNKFKDEEKKILEHDAFAKSERLAISEFVLRLGKIIPKNISLTAIDCKDTGVNLRGAVRGAPQLASGIASQYEKLLKEDKFLAERFESISLTTLSPDAQSGRMMFEIVCKLKSAPAAKK
jgi:hypothetical protein